MKKSNYTLRLGVLVVVFLLLLPTVSITASSFSYENKDVWYGPELEYLTLREIALFPNEGFQSSMPVSRLEFVDMLAKALHVHYISQSSFSDVSFDETNPDSKTLYIGWAEKNHLVNGTAERTFAPNLPITREQMATILGRLLKAGDFNCDGSAAGHFTFLDNEKINDYAKSHIDTLAYLGLLKGDGQGYVLPQKALTQAEAVAVLARLLKNAKNTQPPQENGEYRCVPYNTFPEDISTEVNKLESIPYDYLDSYYGKGWICLQNLEAYTKVASEINSYLQMDDLNTVLVDPVPLDSMFFSTHNVIVLNLQSFNVAGFRITQADFYVHGDTLTAIIKTDDVLNHLDDGDIGGLTSDGIGYAIFVTVPKSVLNVKWGQ